MEALLGRHGRKVQSHRLRDRTDTRGLHLARHRPGLNDWLGNRRAAWSLVPSPSQHSQLPGVVRPDNELWVVGDLHLHALAGARLYDEFDVTFPKLECLDLT